MEDSGHDVGPVGGQDTIGAERQTWAQRHAMIIYTLLRAAIFIACWVLVQLVTPLRGLIAVAVALLLSGIISMVALDRQRDAMSRVVGGFFSRINERIDRSTRAEDDEAHDGPAPDSAPDGEPPTPHPGPGQPR